VVEVVGEAHCDAALRRVDKGALDDREELGREVEVVESDLERSLRRRDPVGDFVRSLFRRLAAVGERVKLYRAAFIAALCARFAAW
jgi:hypothetical protein